MKNRIRLIILAGLGLALCGCTPWQECFSINAAYRTFLVEAAPKMTSLPKTVAAARTKYHKEFDERNCAQFGMARY